MSDLGHVAKLTGMYNVDKCGVTHIQTSFPVSGEKFWASRVQT